MSTFSFVPPPKKAKAASWYDSHWYFRRAITIDNTGNANTLTNYQVQVTLNNTNFDFSKAKSDGSDIRFTDSDGTTLIPYWIESWDAVGQTAVLWPKVPSIPASSTKIIYMYYGNSGASNASNGDSTFKFFDDFESSSSEEGYYSLSSAQTVLQKDQAWETFFPHTLSVVEYNSGGYQYWGYYGLHDGAGGVGLARSNNLSTWDKYTSNPLFLNGRWPSVLKVGNTFYMIYTKDYVSNSYIKLATSTDGINFSDVETVVPATVGKRNQNPNLYYNPNDGKYYLYWYSNNSGNRDIMARSASNITDLDVASNTTVLSSTVVIAAPNMMYYDNTYFLSTEILEDVWKVKVYSSSSPISGFTPLPGNPVLADGSACMFQHIFGSALHAYYCKLTGSTWTLDYRTADLSAGRIPPVPVPDTSKWTASGGTWSPVSTTQQDGSTGYVAEGVTTGRQILSSSFSGNDYIIEVYGRQTAGIVWGLGFRVTEFGLLNLYSVNLFESLDATNNLYVYKWVSGSGTTVSNAAVGAINKNTWYKMTIKAYSNNIDVYINDVLKIQTTDSQYSSGKIALYGEAGNVAQFNDILVRKYTSPEPSTTVGSEENVPSYSLTITGTNLVEGQIVSGIYRIEVQVYNWKMIKYVEFYIDDVLKYTDYQYPFYYDWDTTQYHSPHTVKIIAYDKYGNKTEVTYNVFVMNELPGEGLDELPYTGL